MQSLTVQLQLVSHSTLMRLHTAAWVRECEGAKRRDKGTYDGALVRIGELGELLAVLAVEPRRGSARRRVQTAHLAQAWCAI